MKQCIKPYICVLRWLQCSKTVKHVGKQKGKQISLPMSSCNISVFPVNNVLLVLLVCSITTDLCTSVSMLLLLSFAQC